MAMFQEPRFSGRICVTIFIILTLAASKGTAQQTRTYSDVRQEMQEAEHLLDAGLYTQAYEAYANAERDILPTHEPEFRQWARDARYGKAKAALYAGHPAGEQYMLEFIRDYRTDPYANIATLTLANYYYNDGAYEAAITYYESLQSSELDAEMLSEARFKQGYSYFVRKEFASAESAFGEVRELRTVYYYPVNYYYGMCKFFREDYQAALAAFERVAQSDKYRDYVPYYIAQIYFAQSEYQKVISYAEPRLSSPDLKNKEEIQLILGRAYFETGNYSAALPHLSAYASQSRTMRAEDFYQLAFSQYQAGDCASASTNFKQIASQENLLGQRANFYLADCYLKSGDKTSARNAFRNVSKMSYDPVLRDEALLQYGRVSAELNYDAEAIRAFDAISPSSRWYSDAQEGLRNIFQSTRDYATALNTLESFQSLSAPLKTAYQELALNRGMQLMLDNDLKGADASLAKVQTYPVHAGISAQGLYWRAEIAHRQNQYEKSADFLRQYFTLVNSGASPAPESAPGLAYYMQGYNYLHQKNYSVAQTNFQNAITQLKQHSGQYPAQYGRTILPDAMVRAGDCAFKRNQYSDARNFYQDAIPLGGSYMVYAKYQKAMIEGLERRPQSKINQLEQMVIDHGDSDLADDVLFQLGITYQESGMPEKAIGALQKLLSKYPNSDLTTSALLQLGLLSYNKGDIQEALTYYKRVFTQQPAANEGREALSAIEEIYMQDLKNPDAYFEFVSSVPGYAVSNLQKDSLSYRVAEIQYEKADYASAINAFTDYLKKFPKGIYVPSAYFYRGDAHAILKQYSDALADFESVANLGRSQYQSDALQRAAVLAYNYTQNFDAALRLYQSLRELTTDPAKRFEAELGMARSAYRAGKYQDAVKWSETVAGNALANEGVRAEVYYYGAKSAFELKDLDQALEKFRKVATLAQNEQAAESRYRIAQIYFLKGHPDAAEEQCNSANERNANYPYWVAKSLILLSDIAAERKDYFNAKAPLEAVIENFQGDAAIVKEAREKLEKIKQMEQQQSRVSQDTGGALQFIQEEPKDE